MCTQVCSREYRQRANAHLSRNKGHRVCGVPGCEVVAGSELNAFERILVSLHEAALDPARWPGASALIDEALGTQGNTLACGDGESEEDYRTYFMWICHRGHRRQDLERLWLGTLYPLDERAPRLRRLPFYRLSLITDFYTEEERKTSEPYNALRTVAHAGNGIDVRLDGPRGTRILWEINDPLDGRAGRPRSATRFGGSCPTSARPCTSSRPWRARMDLARR